VNFSYDNSFVAFVITININITFQLKCRIPLRPFISIQARKYVGKYKLLHEPHWFISFLCFV
jgi:hypothetical protein